MYNTNPDPWFATVVLYSGIDQLLSAMKQHAEQCGVSFESNDDPWNRAIVFKASDGKGFGIKLTALKEALMLDETKEWRPFFEKPEGRKQLAEQFSSKD